MRTTATSKTSLVHHACSRVVDSALILAGACLPLTSMTVPFLPIRAALRGARHGGPTPLFELDNSNSNVPITFDAWLEDVCAERPVILTVDDLHWADQSTLDLLMCLLAGPADRRLAVVGTIRSAGVHDSSRARELAGGRSPIAAGRTAHTEPSRPSRYRRAGRRPARGTTPPIACRRRVLAHEGEPLSQPTGRHRYVAGRAKPTPAPSVGPEVLRAPIVADAFLPSTTARRNIGAGRQTTCRDRPQRGVPRSAERG